MSPEKLQDPENEFEYREADEAGQRKPDVVVSEGDFLLIDGRSLTSKDDPELLRYALSDFEYIRSALKAGMENNRRQHPDLVISTPPLFAVKLASAAGRRPFKVVEEEAYWSNDTGGSYRHISDIKPKYHAFWIAVEQSGLVPEVRHLTTRGSSDVWLYARLPEMDLSQKSFNPERQVYDYEAVFAGMNVGTAQLRLAPSKSDEMPEGFESHVYYDVEEKYRGKGYGTMILDGLIKIAQGRGLNELVATVDADNIASIKIIEKNGGQLIAKGLTVSSREVIKYLIKPQAP
jgi:predicted acetyltransferase